MSHIIITKWIEPYVLLETAKKHFPMKDFTFDGVDKNIHKNRFLKELKCENSLGLYMKNVNKFYLFTSSTAIDINILISEFDFKEEDYLVSEDIDIPFDMIDTGKAEASFIML